VRTASATRRLKRSRAATGPASSNARGPTGLITTTTWAALHPETETRLLSLTVRDDKEQTRAVIHSLADHASGAAPAPPDLTPWRALQTWLGKGHISLHSTANLQPSPTDVEQVSISTAPLSCISPIRGSLPRAVHDLVSDLVSHGAQSSVRPTERQTVHAVIELYHANDDQPITVASLASRLDLDNSAALRRARVAVRDGYLDDLQEGIRHPHRLVPGVPLPEQVSVLPPPDDLPGVGGEGGHILSLCTANLQTSPTDGGEIPL